VLVVHKHHLLVRCSHWLNVPILLGLILSGLSILGISGLSAQTRSTDGKRRSSRGHRYLDMHACAQIAPLRQSAGLGLQPHKPWSRHAGSGRCRQFASNPDWDRRIGTDKSLVWSDRQKIKPNSPEVLVLYLKRPRGKISRSDALYTGASDTAT